MSVINLKRSGGLIILTLSIFALCLCGNTEDVDLSFQKVEKMNGKWEVQIFYCENEQQTEMKYKQFWEVFQDTIKFYAINRNGDDYCYHNLYWIKFNDSVYRDVNGGPLYLGWSEDRKMNVIQYTAGAVGFGFQTNTFFVKDYFSNLPPQDYPSYCK